MEEMQVSGGDVRPALVESSRSLQSATVRPVPPAAPEELLASWIGETLLAAERAASGNPEALSLFWVRLYGVLTDAADFVALTCTEGDQPCDGLCTFPLARGRSDASPLPAVMARVRALFDDDELTYIEYRRHVECDPFQTRYRGRRNRQGVSAHVPSALLGGRPITREHAEAALARVLRKHDGCALRVGFVLARRGISALRDLHLAAS